MSQAVQLQAMAENEQQILCQYQEAQLMKLQTQRTEILERLRRERRQMHGYLRSLQEKRKMIINSLMENRESSKQDQKHTVDQLSQKMNSFLHLENGSIELKHKIVMPKLKSFIFFNVDEDQIEIAKQQYFTKYRKNQLSAQKSLKKKDELITEINNLFEDTENNDVLFSLSYSVRNVDSKIRSKSHRELMNMLRDEQDETKRMAIRKAFLDRQQHSITLNKKVKKQTTSHSISNINHTTKFDGKQCNQMVVRLRGFKLMEDKRSLEKTDKNISLSPGAKNSNRLSNEPILVTIPMLYYLHFDGESIARMLEHVDLDALQSSKSKKDRKRLKLFKAKECNAVIDYAGYGINDKYLSSISIGSLAMIHKVKGYRDQHALEVFQALWDSFNGGLFEKEIMKSGQLRQIKSPAYRKILSDSTKSKMQTK